MEKNKKDIIKYHIYDFLIRCRINRNQHEVFMKQYERHGIKTLDEWQNLTGLKPIQ